MSKQDITISTIDELVAFVTSNLYNADRKWMLDDHSKMEWDDPEAGRAWDAENSANPYLSSFGHKKEEHEAYEAKNVELQERKPKQHQVVYWSLRESGDGWHHTYIQLSTEMGEMLDKVWKRKPSYRCSIRMVRTGYVTIPGLLKRLGMVGFDKQIANAKAVAEAKKEKNNRNYYRNEVIELANKIHFVMEKHPELFTGFDLTLYNLQNLKMEE